MSRQKNVHVILWTTRNHNVLKTFWNHMNIFWHDIILSKQYNRNAYTHGLLERDAIAFHFFRIPYARHYNPRFVYFLPTFWSPKNVFSRGFFLKILDLCMVSIQERFLIKSGLWWRAYGIHFLVNISSSLNKKKIALVNEFLFHST